MFRNLVRSEGKLLIWLRIAHTMKKKWLLHGVYPLMPERQSRVNPTSIWHHSLKAPRKRNWHFDIWRELVGLLTGADVPLCAPCPKLKCWINCILDYPNHPRINCDITGLPTDCDNLQISEPSDFGYSQALFGCCKICIVILLIRYLKY